MRVFFVVGVLVYLMSANSFGQSIQCDSIYTKVDEAPSFKGGYDNLAFYIDNLDYGDCLLNKTLILTWTIDRSGHMIDIDTPNLEGECKARVIAQLAKFPKWSPARVLGMPVCFKIKLRKAGDEATLVK